MSEPGILRLRGGEDAAGGRLHILNVGAEVGREHHSDVPMRMSQEGRTATCLPKGIDGSMFHLPWEFTQLCLELTTSTLPSSYPMKGHLKVLTSEMASQDTTRPPAAPPSLFAATSCSPRHRPDFGRLEVMPQFCPGLGLLPGAIRVAAFFLWLPSWLP